MSKLNPLRVFLSVISVALIWNIVVLHHYSPDLVSAIGITLVITVALSALFWGDLPNILIFLAGGLLGVLGIWSLDYQSSSMTGWEYFFYFLVAGNVGIFFMKVAFSIRSRLHPREFNREYLDKVAGQIREVNPKSY